MWAALDKKKLRKYNLQRPQSNFNSCKSNFKKARKQESRVKSQWRCFDTLSKRPCQRDVTSPFHGVLLAFALE